MLLKLLYILIAIVILGIIMMVHELGHFVVGRLCGMGVVEFSLGMGPKILGWKRKETQYSLRAIPLGAYCKFVGEDEENPASNAMNNQPVWKRFLTVLAGPAMNFVFAYLISVVLLTGYYSASLLPRIDQVIADMPAEKAGFQAGDVVTQVAGEPVTYDNDGALLMRRVIEESDMTRPIPFTVTRAGESVRMEVIPEKVVVEQTDPETGETVSQTAYQIGIQFGTRRFTFFEAVKEGFGYLWDFTKLMLESLKDLVFHGKGVKEMSGPVGIISFVSDQISEGFYMVLMIVLVISLNLGIMNLLPIPALDGGRLVLLIVEGIRRKPIPPEKEGMVHGAGFLLLILLMLFVTYQDIVRLITGG